MEYKNWLASKFKEIFDLVTARRDKYNGASDDDFLQIRHAAEQTGMTTEQAIRFMMNMKMSRLNWGADAEDDSMDDTVKDIVGYSMLWLRFREAESQQKVRIKEMDLTDSILEPTEEAPGFMRTFKNFMGAA